MSNTTISFGATVSLKQAANLIVTNPTTRFMVRGEPGIGKSSMLKVIGSRLGESNYNIAYIDVPNMDLGDIAMPVVDHENHITRYYPNARFRLHEGKPVVIMLDEFTKGADPIKNMLHPMLEVANPRLGDVPIPSDSIVFLTGNLGSDGVGDNLKAHTRNRIVEIVVSKPSSDEWLEWAVNNGIDSAIMAWVNQFPHALASYLEDADGNNPYIYNPKKVQTAYVSPRSLEIASNIVKTREHNDPDSVIAALKGCVGESAARDIQAFIDYQDQLPTWEGIITAPKKAVVPESAGACAVLVFGAISKLERTTITPFMEYIGRLEPEWQACFAINVARNPSKQAIAFSSKTFADWVQKNEDLL